MKKTDDVVQDATVSKDGSGPHIGHGAGVQPGGGGAPPGGSTPGQDAPGFNPAIAFVGFLIGLAYQEAVKPVTDAITAREFDARTATMFLSFFLLGLMTFLTGYLSIQVAPFQGLSWFLNFLVLSMEALVLVFMAGTTSVKASLGPGPGFLGYLLVYASIVCLWAIAVLIFLPQMTQQPGIKRSKETLQSGRLSIAPLPLMMLVVAGYKPYSLPQLLLLGGLIVTTFVLQLKLHSSHLTLKR
jgi:hypothetical protein